MIKPAWDQLFPSLVIIAVAAAIITGVCLAWG